MAAVEQGLAKEQERLYGGGAAREDLVALGERRVRCPGDACQLVEVLVGEGAVLLVRNKLRAGGCLLKVVRGGVRKLVLAVLANLKSKVPRELRGVVVERPAGGSQERRCGDDQCHN